MWWLDDNLNRGNPGDRERILFRAGMPVSPGPQSTPQKLRKLELTEAQQAANQTLLETEPLEDPETKRFLADIVSLEQAVREQKSRHEQAIAQLQESAQQSIEQLKSDHKTETEKLSNQLTSAEQVGLEQRSLLADRESQAKQLRELLAAAEQKLRVRDGELAELHSQSEARREQYAQNLAEAEYQHSIESNHLQAIASSAQQRAEERKAVIDNLESELRRREHAHRAESDALVKSYDLKMKQAITELNDAHHKISALASEIARQNRKTHALREKNELAERRASTAVSEAESATLELIKSEEDCGQRIAAISELTRQLQAADERAREAEERARETEERARETEERVQQAEERAREADERVQQAEHCVQQEIERSQQAELRAQQASEREREADARAHQAESLFQQEIERAQQAETCIQQEIGRAKQAESRSQQSEERAQQAEVRISKLEQQHVDLNAAHRAETENLERQNAELQRLLERHQDAVVDQSKQNESTVWELRAECDALRKQVQQLGAESANIESQHASEVKRLNGELQQRQYELDSLRTEIERTTSELDRSQGSRERLKLQNERLLEMHDSRYTSLQARVDELIVSLDDERHKRAAVEKEAKRLSSSRSQRIACLGQQRDQFSSQLAKLRAEMDRLRKSESNLSAAVASAERSLQEANGRIATGACEVDRLRAQLDAKETAAAKMRRADAEEIAAARKEIARLTASAAEANQEVQSRQQQIDEILRDKQEHEPDFAIIQRDRTIARLEQEAFVMRERLQREAAARRKAEGVMKRRASKGKLDPSAQEAWSEIDSQNQLERLQRHANALRNINLLERQRSSAEIARYKKEIERLKAKSSKRAA